MRRAAMMRKYRRTWPVTPIQLANFQSQRKNRDTRLVRTYALPISGLLTEPQSVDAT